MSSVNFNLLICKVGILIAFEIGSKETVKERFRVGLERAFQGQFLSYSSRES